MGVLEIKKKKGRLLGLPNEYYYEYIEKAMDNKNREYECSICFEPMNDGRETKTLKCCKMQSFANIALTGIAKRSQIVLFVENITSNRKNFQLWPVLRVSPRENKSSIHYAH